MSSWGLKFNWWHRVCHRRAVIWCLSPSLSWKQNFFNTFICCETSQNNNSSNLLKAYFELASIVYRPLQKLPHLIFTIIWNCCFYPQLTDKQLEKNQLREQESHNWSDNWLNSRTLRLKSLYVAREVMQWTRWWTRRHKIPLPHWCVPERYSGSLPLFNKPIGKSMHLATLEAYRGFWAPASHTGAPWCGEKL